MDPKGNGRRPPHIPVLLGETINGLDLKPGNSVIDCTVGAGGHSAVMLERTAPDGRLLGLDIDEAALDAARMRLSRFGSRVMLVRANYREVEKAVSDHRFGPAQAALLDLGYSSMEIDDPERGFGFRADGPLDMRFDRRQELTAADLVNSLSEGDLASILAKYGEERYARRIAERIAAEREKHPLQRTFELVDAVARAVPAHYRHGKLHFATRTFQALRIALNDELGNLEEALPALLRVLAPGGRLAVISFHSLEDRIVKNFFRQAESEGSVKTVTRRPITAQTGEIRENPRSRSAKLRLAEKTTV
ncbi:16S rRNA (cytosine(1402)-N(4))-methyltransferase RsmH [Candidatus Uhrbacteria bacterium]|nr:16S rRNA (cytosine(1402)-N(4))-methyltransferase RsmH [Candidatus Uhrbacteria bacterium]